MITDRIVGYILVFMIAYIVGRIIGEFYVRYI